MRALPAALLLLAGCAAAGAPPPACPAGTQSATVAEAYFGRNSGGREAVTDAEWARFLDEVLTPAFPDGLTVLDGAGQWRGRSGIISRERSKVLVVAMPGATPAAALARLDPVRRAYTARFAQESVMVTTRSACVGF
jgi:hypothetical protein